MLGHCCFTPYLSDCQLKTNSLWADRRLHSLDIIFLGTVKWSCGHTMGQLSDLTVVPPGPCIEAWADGFLVSLHG